MARDAEGYRVRTPYGDGQAATRGDLAYLMLECLAYGFVEETGETVAHAGAFETATGAIVYFGGPHAGKSTLSFAAWLRDARIIGDDRIALNPAAGTVAAFPKCIKLRVDPADPPPLPLAGKVPADKIIAGQIHGDHRYILARSLPRMASYGAATPIRALVCLERRNLERRARAEPLDVRAAYETILPQVISPHLDALAVLRLVKAHAAGHSLLRLIVGEDQIEAALERLDELDR